MARPREVVVNCQHCGSEHTRMLMAREREHDIYRRWKCQDCGHRFSSTERIASLHSQNAVCIQKMALGS